MNMMHDQLSIPVLDPLSAAKHEIGHALVQARLEIGPQWVKIFKNSDRGWGGQSLPFNSAERNEMLARLFVSQLGGPIAQICAARESLGSLQDAFSTDLLIPSIGIWEQDVELLNRIQWGSDLFRGNLLCFARTVQAVRSQQQFYRDGGFLFEAEGVLFEVFRDPNINHELSRLAEELADKTLIDEQDFLRAARPVIKHRAWDALSDLDLDFSLAQFK